MSVSILVEIISKRFFFFFFSSTQNRETTMQKSLSCEKSYPTHISTVTELRQCADSTFQSSPEHPTLGHLLFTIPAGLGTVLEKKQTSPCFCQQSGARVVRTPALGRAAASRGTPPGGSASPPLTHRETEARRSFEVILSQITQRASS